MSSIFAWASRRAGGLAMLSTIALSYWVLSREARAAGFQLPSIYFFSAQSPRVSTPSTMPTNIDGAGLWTVAFAYYALLIHILVFAFPIRSCFAVLELTKSVGRVSRSKSLKDIKLTHPRRGSSTSLSSSETLTSGRDIASPSVASSDAGDYENEFLTDADAERVVHAIIIPNYKEEVDTLRETLDVLASHPQARDCYDVSCHQALWPPIFLTHSLTRLVGIPRHGTA